MTIQIPSYVLGAISRLEQHGFQAYAVGGCVRDSLMGQTPQDWDLCTSAPPENTIACFSECPVQKTGMKHGTVLVQWEGRPIEITTFRVDGNYSDVRHPDQVHFTSSLEEDLARRDFTINAMAYHPKLGLLDLFGGQKDLALGVVRCVGDPKLRFEEDALRILRGMRFAARLEFSIHQETKDAMEAAKGRLSRISLERISVEWNGILLGDAMAPVLLEHASIVATFLPEILPVLADKTGPWEKIVGAMTWAAPELPVRWTLLLYGIFRYGGGENAAKDALHRLYFGKQEAARIFQLLLHSNDPLTPDPVVLKKRLRRMGDLSQMHRLFQVQTALAEVFPSYGADPLMLLEARHSLERITEAGECVFIKDLAVSGRDLFEIGYAKGPAVGVCLEILLEHVVEGRLENQRAPLLARARALQKTAQRP